MEAITAGVSFMAVKMWQPFLVVGPRAGLLAIASALRTVPSLIGNGRCLFYETGFQEAEMVVLVYPGLEFFRRPFLLAERRKGNC